MNRQRLVRTPKYVVQTDHGLRIETKVLGICPDESARVYRRRKGSDVFVLERFQEAPVNPSLPLRIVQGCLPIKPGLAEAFS